MQLRLLSADDLRTVMDMPAAIDAVASAFARLSEGRARAPLRTALEVEGGVTLVMPAWVPGGAGGWRGDGGAQEAGGGSAKVDMPPGLGAKIVSVFPGNAPRGKPSVNALMVLVDVGTGEPRAVLEGNWLTALRTGAASGAATLHLGRPDAAVLAVFGAGAQARTQIAAVLAVRPIREVRIVSRGGRSAEILAAELRGSGAVWARAVADPASALVSADVVVTATDSLVPVFPGDTVEPGTHVNAVGSFTTEMREVDGELIRRATVVVDDREAAWAEAGDLVGALRDGMIDRGHVQADLGEVVRGLHPGRTSAGEITFFKSVGSAIQDVAVAAEALRRAEEDEVGVVVEL